MPTLVLIEENSSTCPVTTTSGATGGVGIPLLLMGAVGVLTVVGLVASSGGRK